MPKSTINLINLPTSPGCYLYRDALGEIIYVGKAINLKKRVSQYFHRDDALGPKTQTLVSQIASIETKVVGSEIEALILESSLIKKYRPKYNSLLKDDRSYSYIVITNDLFPLVYSTHYSSIPPKSTVFGPFPSGKDVVNLLSTIHHIFPYYKKAHPKTECLYCHLNQCPGPNPNRQDYLKTISKIKKILNNKFSLLRRQLVSEIKKVNQPESYEKALALKKQLDSLDYIVSGWRNLKNLFESVNLSEDKQSQAINELKTTINLPKINRIECYDISQMGTKYFVGSMVVWQNGAIDKSQYKKFKINTKVTPDDQYMIKEVVFRRLRHPEWGTPDLIMVDGGKPQVSSVTTITDLPIIGLAKKFETIVIKNQNGFQEINLPANSSALNLLKSLRDEAHRFANYYRRQLMSQSSGLLS
ncbi:MAG TPA: GIY-YIG nuclease family protein [Candidatus Woesebacteria bacterium]|nr:GIY-YIG nuclease family protein [Candidatus Woesebacteria bacterium]